MNYSLWTVIPFFQKVDRLIMGKTTYLSVYKFSCKLVFVFSLLFYAGLNAQTTIWAEDFNSYSNGTSSGTGTGTSPVNWNSQAGGAVSGGLILASNTRNVAGSTLANPLIWVTDPIDINAYLNVTFSIDTGAFNVGNFEDSGGAQDNFTLEYRINGGAGSWVTVVSASGSAVQPINPTYSISGLAGSTLEIRAKFHNTAGNENYTIDNVLVTGFPAVSNQPPVLTATGDQVYCPGTSMPITEAISITDPDDISTNSVYIQISTGYVSTEDLLTLTGVHPNITSSWDAVQGELSLTGPATYTEFETAILGVEYTSSAPVPAGTRQFSITVGTANYLPSTGHYYEYVPSLGITWTSANTAANSRTYFGLQGYLATLTSQVEADFSGSQASGVGWIGGSDAATEGVWLWVTGPEAGTNFWNGTAGGSTPNFAFWNTGEPNQSGNEDYAHITHPNVNPNGSWNDLTNTGATSGNYQPQGYVVEYGGMPGDPVLSLTATTTLNMDTVDPTASNPAPVTVYCSSEVPAADISIVNDEADNCTSTPMVTYISDVSDGGSNPEIITRTYRITDESGNSVDVTQTITVNDLTISTQPVSQQVFAGSTGIFTVGTTNADTYQWQLSINGGVSYNNILDGASYSGTTTSSLSILSPDLEENGYLFRVHVSNSGSACPSITSNSALLTIRISSVITNRRITYRVNKN